MDQKIGNTNTHRQPYASTAAIELGLTYVLFLILVGGVSILCALSNQQWATAGNISLIVRCFDLIELLLPGSPIHRLSDDPFDLLGVHLMLASFYLSYSLYLYLKIKQGQKLAESNLSPFLLSFGLVSTAISLLLVFFSSAGIFFILFGGYNIVGLFLQYLAFTSQNRVFLRRSFQAMVIVNVAGLSFNLYLVIKEIMWRFHPRM